MLLFFLLFLFIIGILMGKLEINIKKVQISNIEKKLSFEYDIAIHIVIFYFLRVATLKLNHKQSKNLIKSLTKQNLDIGRFDFKNQFKIIRKTRIDIKNLDIDISIGTNSGGLTVYIVAIISSIIPIIFRKRHLKYVVKPIYNKGNKIKLNIECIVDIKFVHIINTIFIIIKERGREYGGRKTSNRRAYDYSHE